MIVDNKTAGKKKVHQHLAAMLEAGTLDLVSGYFTIGALVWLARECAGKIRNTRMVLGDLAVSEKTEDNAALLDLFHTSISWEDAFGLAGIAQEAVAFLETQEVQIRTTRPDFCHAKLFHHRSEREYGGFYVTGSANLTEAGLGLLEDRGNWELNLLGQGSEENFKAIGNWFASLWDDPRTRTEIVEGGAMITTKDFFIGKIRSLFARYTPREVYLRMLAELYPQTRNESDASYVRLMERLEHSRIWKDLYPFQQAGVIDLVQKMERTQGASHGGAILADAVGLGKTWSALAVIKYYQLQGRRCLLLCPKKLDRNWMRYRKGQGSRFERDSFDYDVRYHTSLKEDLFDMGPSGEVPLRTWQGDQPILVVVDESHNFRNDRGERYEFLMNRILRENRDVRVLLLSATPLNTDIKDVRNQLKLLVRGADDGFAESLGITRLEEPFRQASRVFREWAKEPDDSKRNLRALKEKIPEAVKELFDKVVVARNRGIVVRHDTSLSFPKHTPPQNLFVALPGIGKYKGIQAILEQLPRIFPAYSQAWYARPAQQEDRFGDDATRSFFLTKLLHVLLAKRLESSWTSFRSTVEALARVHVQVQKGLQAWNAAQRKAKSKVIYAGPTMEFDEEAEEIVLPESIDFAEIANFKRIKEFERDLDAACYKLTEMLKALDVFEKNVTQDSSADPKLKALQDLVAEKSTMPNPRILIFTAYADTARYLYEKLKSDCPHLAMVTGQDAQANDGRPILRSADPILDRFAPRTKLYREKDWPEFDLEHPDRHAPGRYEAWKEWVQKKDTATAWKLSAPIDVLIATDVLSEGQNLQDCDLVVNYDIHWNPVRLVQRFGRIDRLESPNEEIGMVNFWPSKDVEEYLQLKIRVESRMIAGGLVDQEALATSEEMRERATDEEADQKSLERYLRQLEHSPEELRTDGLDMTDLANDDRFRAELLDEIKKRAGALNRIPRGVYSGFTYTLDGQGPWLVALLGFPRRSAHDARTGKPYQSTHLVCLDSEGRNRIAEKNQILELLSENRDADRWVSEAIDVRQPEALGALRLRVETWLESQRVEKGEDGAVTAGKEAKAALKKMLTGSVKKRAAAADAATGNFLPQNLDLVAWMVLDAALPVAAGNGDDAC
ncbi:MAG: hypothetical protein RL318_1993 [Fibrobacterota bacterium]|jgi:ERCC4-related helicase